MVTAGTNHTADAERDFTVRRFEKTGIVSVNRMIRRGDGQKDLKNSLELAETVFTESEGEESGKIVRRNKKQKVLSARIGFDYGG